MHCTAFASWLVALPSIDPETERKEASLLPLYGRYVLRSCGPACTHVLLLRSSLDPRSDESSGCPLAANCPWRRVHLLFFCSPWTSSIAAPVGGGVSFGSSICSRRLVVENSILRRWWRRHVRRLQLLTRWASALEMQLTFNVVQWEWNGGEKRNCEPRGPSHLVVLFHFISGVVVVCPIVCCVPYFNRNRGNFFFFFNLAPSFLHFEA